MTIVPQTQHRVNVRWKASARQVKPKNKEKARRVIGNTYQKKMVELGLLPNPLLKVQELVECGEVLVYALQNLAIQGAK
jgi:hypothetical protein